jgi:hypothetical protein
VSFVRYLPVGMVVGDSGIRCGVNQFFVLLGFFAA